MLNLNSRPYLSQSFIYETLFESAITDSSGEPELQSLTIPLLMNMFECVCDVGLECVERLCFVNIENKMSDGEIAYLLNENQFENNAHLEWLHKLNVESIRECWGFLESIKIKAESILQVFELGRERSQKVSICQSRFYSNAQKEELISIRLVAIEGSVYLENLDVDSDPILIIPVVKMLSFFAGSRGAIHNFSNLDLVGLNLADVDLRNTNFNGAKLINANLRGANLQGATFILADLRGANLSKADLRLSTMTSASLGLANLQSANFEKATLDRVDFSWAKLQGACFVGANLFLSYFGMANLTNVNFTRSRLEQADFNMANLTDADFSAAILIDAMLYQVVLCKTKFDDTSNLIGATLIPQLDTKLLQNLPDSKATIESVLLLEILKSISTLSHYFALMKREIVYRILDKFENINIGFVQEDLTALLSNDRFFSNDQKIKDFIKNNRLG